MSGEHIAHGTPGALREFVAECLHLSAFYADLGVRYASVADDRGLEVSLKKSVAAIRQAVTVMRMLSDANEATERSRLTAMAARMGAAATLADEGSRPR